MRMLLISNVFPKCVAGSDWIMLPCFDLNAGTIFFFCSHQIKIRVWVLFGLFFFLIVAVDKTSIVAFTNKMTWQARMAAFEVRGSFIFRDR